jgi:VanZ family protein
VTGCAACSHRPSSVSSNPRSTLLFLVFYASLIAFGSLHPFTGLMGLEHWSGEFITAPLPRFVTRNDISTNLLAYLPLGYALALRLGLPRRRLGAILLATLVGFFYSVSMESVQQIMPARIASNLDIFLNTLGVFIGALLSLHHQRWLRAGRALGRWRRRWFRPEPAASFGLALLLLWVLAQFTLQPVPGAGWLGLHLRPIDTPPAGLDQINWPWFAAAWLEIAALGTFAASLLRPGRYVGAMVSLVMVSFAVKLLVATLLLRLKVVGGVLSLETLAAFLLAFWFLLIPQVSRQRRRVALLLLVLALGLRVAQADYLLWPIASVFNIIGLAKAAASLWLWLAVAVLLVIGLRRHLIKHRRRKAAAKRAVAVVAGRDQSSHEQPLTG